MTKRIFWSILSVALAVFVLCVALIMGLLHSYYTQVQLRQLRDEANLAARGMELEGIAYFEDLTVSGSRVTWIGPDGTVRYDSENDPTTMDDHSQREEFRQALQEGRGQSIRMSQTLMERQLYYALRLSDGTVLRLSTRQDTVLTLLLGAAQPICVTFAIVLVLALVLASGLSKRIVEPMSRMDMSAPAAYPELQPIVERFRAQQKQLRFQTERLRRRQEEFDTVTWSMQEGLVLLGRELEIISMNRAAGRLLQPQDLQPGGCLRSLLEGALAGQHTVQQRTFADREYQLDAGPVQTDGQITGVVLLCFDVTEKERSEALRKAFTANVSHELKTPLHAISGYAELMAEGVAKPEDTAQFARQIYRETQRLVGLVEDILKLSQLDEGGTGMTREDCDLFAIAGDCVERLSSVAQNAQVSLLLTGKEAPMVGISQLLTGIVHNLCDNAIKYNRPGGRVEVQVVPRDNEVVLTVTDTGIGIPTEHQDRIFERFYRVDKSRSKAVGGTGLGLSIVKHAAKLHGAAITLDSAPGEGTTISVRFPAQVD